MRLAAFGNNHSIGVNLRYRRFHRAAVQSWHPMIRPSSEARAAAAQFAQQGWSVLPSAVDAPTAAALGRRIDALFEAGDGVVQLNKGLLRLIDGIERVPEAANFISGFVAEVIESYFNSYFKIYNISFYRTLPTDEMPESSFLWHFDNAPDQEIKVMVYFDKVFEDTGAFRFKDRSFSEELRGAGFWHRKNYQRFAALLEEKSSTICLEGEPGTTILFQNGRVAHKATAPRRLHRDIATFVLIPSLIPWREHFARNRHLLSTNAGLCINPWTDEPEHIGYRY